jgi:hypothetical protein
MELAGAKRRIRQLETELAVSRKVNERDGTPNRVSDRPALRFTRSAEKELRRLDPPIRTRIFKALGRLMEEDQSFEVDPQPVGDLLRAPRARPPAVWRSGLFRPFQDAVEPRHRSSVRPANPESCSRTHSRSCSSAASFAVFGRERHQLRLPLRDRRAILEFPAPSGRIAAQLPRDRRRSAQAAEHVGRGGDFGVLIIGAGTQRCRRPGRTGVASLASGHCQGIQALKFRSPEETFQPHYAPIPPNTDAFAVTAIAPARPRYLWRRLSALRSTNMTSPQRRRQLQAKTKPIYVSATTRPEH